MLRKYADLFGKVNVNYLPNKSYPIDGQDFKINPFCISKDFRVNFLNCGNNSAPSLLEAFDFVLSTHENIQPQDYLNILKCKNIQEKFINGGSNENN